jgi:hypothetical protein
MFFTQGLWQVLLLGRGKRKGFTITLQKYAAIPEDAGELKSEMGLDLLRMRRGHFS